MSDSETIRQARCAACGLPGHRYGRNEGMERYDPMACINQLRGELERVQGAAGAYADWLDGPTDEEVEKAARIFHETYERLAPEFGYSTRQETRTSWPPPNADLMRATARAVVEAVRPGDQT